jgi:hypothetical protein
MNLLEKNPARRIPIRQPQKSRIDLSHSVFGTSQLGWLTPIQWHACIPGDSFRLKTSVRMDYAPLIRPFMTRVDCSIYNFFVSNRLIMPRVGITNTDWEAFIQGDPESIFNNDTVPHTTIVDADIAGGYYDIGSLNSYFGLPIIDSGETTNQTFEIQLMPQIGYWLIVDEFFRNEWLLDRLCGPTSNWNISLQGGDLQGAVGQAIMKTAPYTIPKDMDYFWGATPQAYKGSSDDVELDLDLIATGAVLKWQDQPNGGVPLIGDPTFDGSTSQMREAGGVNGITWEINSDLPGQAVLEVMELRRVQALTRFLEAENRLGDDDYGSWLLSMFGVTNPDFRLNRPHYIGGGRLRTNVNTVLSHEDVLDNANSVDTPAGYHYGVAGIQGSSNQVSFNVTEFGYVYTLMVVKAEPAYHGGIPREFWKINDRTDWYNPNFQNIGDQEIYDGEYSFHLDGDNTGTWAYQQRFAEYKYHPNRIVGEFAVDTSSNGLDHYHMGIIHDITGAADAFNDANSRHTYSNDEYSRVFRSQDSSHHLYWAVYNDAQFVRPMFLTDIPV